jgi:hypothetical protein
MTGGTPPPPGWYDDPSEPEHDFAVLDIDSFGQGRITHGTWTLEGTGAYESLTGAGDSLTDFDEGSSTQSAKWRPRTSSTAGPGNRPGAASRPGHWVEIAQTAAPTIATTANPARLQMSQSTRRDLPTRCRWRLTLQLLIGRASATGTAEWLQVPTMSTSVRGVTTRSSLRRSPDTRFRLLGDSGSGM